MAETPMEKTLEAKKAYTILKDGTSNTESLENAVKYYYNHYDEMNSGYPKLKESLSDSAKSAIEEFAKNEASKLDDAQANSLSSSMSKFITDFAPTEKTGEVDDSEKAKTPEEKAQEEKEEVLKNIMPYYESGITPEENFKLPDMGDFYLGNVDDTFFKMIDKSMRDKVDAKKACHYASTAPQQELGYNKDKDSYFLKCLVSYSESDIEQGLIDGDHIILSIDNMSSVENDPTNALNKLKERVTGANKYFPLLKNNELAGNMLDLKIMGIAAPSMSRWCRETNVKRSTLTIKPMDLSSVNDTEYIYVNRKQDDDSLRTQKGDSSWVYFARICGYWREIRIISGSPDTEFGDITFDWLLSPGEDKMESSDGKVYNLQDSARATAKKLLSEIQKANGVVYLNLDGSGLKENSSIFPIASKGTWAVQTNQSDLERLAKYSGDDIRLTGYNRVSMEMTRRFLGELYVKTSSELSQDVYINLAKLIANDDDVPDGVSYSTSYEGNNISCFDIGSYDINSRTYADAFFETMSQLDDRPQIHKQLLGVDWKELQEYNVILGDICFFVPPTNIRMETYTQSERVPILRAKGTMAKTTPNGESHMQRRIYMDIFFNEEHGINGEDYGVEVPGTGMELVYKMNGLRSLVSMFKFTPFLPITNKFINKTLGIDAVSLISINVQSVPNYPKLIQATISMAEFEWSVYMPDIAQMALEDSYSSLTLEEQLANDDTVAYWNRSEEEKEAEKEEKKRKKDELKAQHIQNILNGVEDDYDESLEELNEPEQKTIIKDSYKNWFAVSINWETFRFYYQRPIIRGNLLDGMGLDFNSETYIKATCGTMTSFVPMHFQDPGIKFYMANEDYLKEILKERFNMLRGVTEISFTPEQIELLKKFGDINDKLKELEQDEFFINSLKELNKNMSSAQKSGNLFSDVTDIWNTHKPYYDGSIAIGKNSKSYNGGCITNGLGLNDETIKSVNSVLAQIDEITKKIRVDNPDYFEQNLDYISYLNGDDGIAVFGLGIKLKENHIGKTQLDAFYKNVSAYIGSDVFNDKVKDYEFARVFADGSSVVIPLAVEIRKCEADNNASSGYGDTSEEDEYYDTESEEYINYVSNRVNNKVSSRTYFGDVYAPKDGAQFEIKGDSGAMKFLAVAKEIAQRYEELNKNGGYSESVPDVNNLMNLKYDAYDIGDVLVTQWNVSLSNTFANLRVLSTDGEAPQYLGGSDTHISLVIRTQDEKAAKKIVNIPKEITRLTRTYHMVMPCVPLRVDSEFTKFFGVNEVTCEYCTISTVDDYPGLYEIRMELISMDRTIREREAAVRRDTNAKNPTTIGTDGFSTNTSPKAGLADVWNGSADFIDWNDPLKKGTVFGDMDASGRVAVVGGAIALAVAGVYFLPVALTAAGAVGGTTGLMSMIAGQAVRMAATGVIRQTVKKGLTALADATITGAIKSGVKKGLLSTIAIGTIYSIFEESGLIKSANVNEGDSFGDGSEVPTKFMQYFEFKKALGENDLYPDLELPKVSEMELMGFYFMRYKFQDERTYVDPDFYFVYPLTIQSQLYRELALNAVRNDACDVKLVDNSGATTTLKVTKGGVVVEKDSNDIYMNQKAVYEARQKEVQKAKDEQKKNEKENKKKNVPEPAVSLLALNTANMERDSWKVCDKINGMFLEKRFYKEIQTILTTEKASQANVTQGTGTSSKENEEASDAQTAANKALGDGTPNDATQDVVQEEDGAKKNIRYTEGKCVREKLQGAQNAADTFFEYLKNTSPFVTAGMKEESCTSLSPYPSSNRRKDSIISDIKVKTQEFLGIDDVKRFLEALNIEITDDFKNIVSCIVVSAACSATADKEYSQKESDDWKPSNNFIGYGLYPGVIKTVVIANGKDTGDEVKALSKSAAIRAEVFSMFGISMYEPSKISDMLIGAEKGDTFESDVKSAQEYEGNTENELITPEEREAHGKSVNMNLFLFDPYYRCNSRNEVEVEHYKYACIMDVKFCTFAYLRLVMYWLYRLVKRWAIPTFTADALRTTTRLQEEVEMADKKLTSTGEMQITGSTGEVVNVQKYIDFYKKGVGQVDNAKIWTAAVLASSDGDAKILKEIDERNYGALNALVKACTTTSANMDPKQDKGAWAIRKMTLALIGQKVITSMNAVGINQALPGNAMARDELQRLYLKAANDPKTYIPHSYHDMVVNDARGRMLRAFPTFYMCFIDEGREIGQWKLHDNFYNTSSIMNIEVVKSRKIPADTCTITMSNFYSSYTTENEDYVKTQVATIDQAWNSIFSPSDYFADQETYRQSKPLEIRLRLRQGARIHVRIGYGNNAAMIPVVFNGVITEVDASSTVSIVAQGDGWELMNPIQIDKNAYELAHTEDFTPGSFDNGDTPLQIATALFNTKGGLINEFLGKHLKMNFGTRNPFGIVHFGNPNFRSLVKCGECCQNLYETTASHPIFGGNIDVKAANYDDSVSEEVPTITFDLFQKTPWDVLNICRSISPDFRLAVIPFGFRSTVFMGSPHFYYCYDYFMDTDGVVKEKRKPFQQWHIYTSEQDIIGDGIVATARDMHNVATGMFTLCESGNIENQETVGPLYADWDIYPESQRTMIVDTSLMGKGTPFVGVLTNSIAQRFDSLDALTGDTDSALIKSYKKIAWRSTATALREGVMDMYAGDLVLFGDPSVKPQDRFYMSDNYTGIMGQALVKEVVYRLSLDTGFTTTISPDCIACVSDDVEIVKTTANNTIGSICNVISSVTSSFNKITEEDKQKYLKRAGGAAVAGAAGYGAARVFGAATGAVNKAKKIKSLVGVGDSIFTTIGRGMAKGMLKAVPFVGWAATLASIVIAPAVNSFIMNELKNYKVIKIFPLKKWGYVYTAGFEGARGSVYGSPTWGDRGSLGDIFDWVQENAPILGFLGDMLFDDDVKAMAEKYKRDSGIIDANGTAPYMETEYGKLQGKLAHDELTYSANNFRKIQFKTRVSVDRPAAFNAAYARRAMTDSKNYKNDPKLNSNYLISQDSRIKPYIDEQFFLIAHEDPGMPVGGSVEETNITLDGKSYRTKIIREVDSEGNEIIDIPMLSSEAMTILFEIIKRARMYMPSANASDPYENFETMKNSYIVLKSALKIGDSKTMGSTGYTFILSATNSDSKRALKSALESLDSDFKLSDLKSIGISTNILSYKEQDDGDISVSVALPEEEVDTGLKRDHKNDNTESNEETQAGEETPSYTTTQEVNQ